MQLCVQLVPTAAHALSASAHARDCLLKSIGFAASNLRFNNSVCNLCPLPRKAQLFAERFCFSFPLHFLPSPLLGWEKEITRSKQILKISVVEQIDPAQLRAHLSAHFFFDGVRGEYHTLDTDRTTGTMSAP